MTDLVDGLVESGRSDPSQTGGYAMLTPQAHCRSRI